VSGEHRTERTRAGQPSTRDNNFDLLRLLAAAQVAFFHCATHLQVPLDRERPLVAFASHLPGVPIFFVVSGFLISLSWERNPQPASYARNRVLRIYPALWVCFGVGVLSAAIVGGVDFLRAGALPWVAAQLTIGQFYNPDFLRGYGIGVLNGSLWTIPVELQFYLLLPLMYRVFRLRERSGIVALAALAAASIAAQYTFLAFSGTASEALPVKLFGVTLAPYLWMFLIGVLLQRNFECFAPWLQGKAILWLAAFALFVALEKSLGITVATNTPNPVPMAVLGCAVIASAYTAPRLGNSLLRGNDISYGLYIYHAVVLNAFVASGARGSWSALGAVLGCSLAAALASWVLIERPALRLKRNALHPASRAH